MYCERQNALLYGTGIPCATGARIMKEEFRPAIEALEIELRDLERKTADTKKMINRLYEISGAAAPYIDVGEAEQRMAGAIRADQFYGKTVTQASREYLEMRKASNRGPASPREIYNALVEGGFKFDAKSVENAMTGMRQTLRKNSAVFHRLPNGQYGLLAWYPSAKQSKPDGEDNGASAKPSTRKIKLKRPRKRMKPAKARAKHGAGHEPITEQVLNVMSNGADWTLDRLKQKFPSTGGRNLQGALISLKSRQMVENVEKGVWRIAAQNSISAESTDESEAAADDISTAAA